MKHLYKLMVIAGALLLFSAAGNDDLYGLAYPIRSMIITCLLGLGLILGGYLIYERNKTRWN